MTNTYRIQIRGRVQGVGFRPFVYNLAYRMNIEGTVSNNEDGVIIEINASKEQVDLFLKEIISSAPKVARISEYECTEIGFERFDGFHIVTSKKENAPNLPITPDFAICDSCKLEVSDSSNHRFDYAFTTCVNCGPRYAITKDFPFERNHTSLHEFEMCNSCHEEYQNPSDKRFHSQTNSCESCGIQLKVTDNTGILITDHQSEALNHVAHLITTGHIIAIKNTNGYLLCCDAMNSNTIQRLRKRKKRSNKPFAVVYPSIDDINSDFHLSDCEKRCLASEVAPIVILSNKNPRIETTAVAPNLSQTGVMLPHTALLFVLMKRIGKPIVATSGNIHGLPIISDEDEAQNKLKDIADFFLHHNLKINFPQDDSVVKFVNDQQIILRRSRGLAPSNLMEEMGLNDTVAIGADLKSAFAIAKNNQTYVSQYFGNLASYDILQRYTSTYKNFQHIFSIRPKYILTDKHQNYYSTQLGKEIAENYQISTTEIQHHKAHFASVLGEHQLFKSKKKILGVIWDGTGLGDDGAIWGGEFFEYQNQEITRVNHFEYFNWIASDKMAKEPRLSLFSLLSASTRLDIQSKFTEIEWAIYRKMIQKNMLKTSSVGRLFDAVSSALDLTDVNTYEAEASMQLEQLACEYQGKNPIDFLKKIDYNQIPSAVIVQQIYSKLKEGYSKDHLAYSFIYTLASAIFREANKRKITTIACSGGVFQNSILIKLLLDSDFEVKLHQKLAPNDENIAYGQLQYFKQIKEKQHVFSSTRKNKGHYITA